MSQIDFFNNWLTLLSQQTLNEYDLSIIKLFFETRRYSNGGDLIEYDYYEHSHILKLNFKENSSKQDVLSTANKNNGIIQFRNYMFKLVECDVNEKYKNLKCIDRMLILKNINQNATKVDDIELFASYLDGDNKVISISFSNFFDNLVYVEYEKPFDLNEVKKKLDKTPKLDGQLIEMYEAYETNSILAKFPASHTAYTEDFFDKFFEQKPYYHWEVPFKFQQSPFVITKFQLHQYKSLFLRKLYKDPEMNMPIIVESNFNIDILNNYLQNYKLKPLPKPQKFNQAYFDNDDESIIEIKIDIDDSDNDDDDDENAVFDTANSQNESRNSSNDSLRLQLNSSSSSTSSSIESISPSESDPTVENNINNRILKKVKITGGNLIRRCQDCDYYAYSLYHYENHTKYHRFHEGYLKCNECKTEAPFYAKTAKHLGNHRRSHHLQPSRASPRRLNRS